MKYNYIKPQVRVYKVQMTHATMLIEGSTPEEGVQLGWNEQTGDDLANEDRGWGDDEGSAW